MKEQPKRDENERGKEKEAKNDGSTETLNYDARHPAQPSPATSSKKEELKDKRRRRMRRKHD